MVVNAIVGVTVIKLVHLEGSISNVGMVLVPVVVVLIDYASQVVLQPKHL